MRIIPDGAVTRRAPDNKPKEKGKFKPRKVHLNIAQGSEMGAVGAKIYDVQPQKSKMSPEVECDVVKHPV